jgi:glycosyltransferase involved in cell wall biosynthesis
MQSWLVKINSGLSEKVEYIPLWHDENISFYKNFESNEYITRYCPGSKFVIQYSGNMGLWNDMETIGRSVNEVPEDIAFMFVGGGVRKKELMDAITPALMERVCFLPFQPAEKLGMLLTACHVALISMQEGLEGMAVPCKIYGILASGIPVIAIVPENSEIASIVNEENCGLIVRPGDKAGLINAIEFLKTHNKLRIEMGLNGRKAFEQKYSTVKVAERYKSIISQLND